MFNFVQQTRFLWSILVITVVVAIPVLFFWVYKNDPEQSISPSSNIQEQFENIKNSTSINFSDDQFWQQVEVVKYDPRLVNTQEELEDLFKEELISSDGTFVGSLESIETYSPRYAESDTEYRVLIKGTTTKLENAQCDILGAFSASDIHESLPGCRVRQEEVSFRGVVFRRIVSPQITPGACEWYPHDGTPPDFQELTFLGKSKKIAVNASEFSPGFVVFDHADSKVFLARAGKCGTESYPYRLFSYDFETDELKELKNSKLFSGLNPYAHSPQGGSVAVIVPSNEDAVLYIIDLKEDVAKKITTIAKSKPQDLMSCYENCGANNLRWSSLDGLEYGIHRGFVGSQHVWDWYNIVFF